MGIKHNKHPLLQNAGPAAMNTINSFAPKTDANKPLSQYNRISDEEKYTQNASRHICPVETSPYRRITIPN